MAKEKYNLMLVNSGLPKEALNLLEKNIFRVEIRTDKLGQNFAVVTPDEVRIIHENVRREGTSKRMGILLPS